jgi:hypothetical protein
MSSTGFLAGATGLEPATFGVTGHMFQMIDQGLLQHRLNSERTMARQIWTLLQPQAY